MGLPVNRIICATNDNNVVSDFMATGVYNSKRPFIQTISPAMDILVSSNLERLLYEASGNDAQSVAADQEDLKASGVYSVDKKTINNYQSEFLVLLRVAGGMQGNDQKRISGIPLSHRSAHGGRNRRV